MGSEAIRILLVTANVGSIFEDPSQMLKVWTEEFLSTVSQLDPKFIALHCQEVGGKNYENSMKHVEDFVSLLMSSNKLRLFDKVRIYLDEDYSSAENFTALGNFYFIHESLEDVSIYNFKDLNFVPANGKEIHSGNIEAVVTKEKAKFPQDFFPECKWSRKGFLRTRWSVNGTVFDLVNIHLFHDASNFVAMEAFPSVYCKNRRRALEHTLQRFHNDDYGKAPFFLFGDFNFRADTDGVIKKLTEGLKAVQIQNNKNNEFVKLQYTNKESQLVLTVGKKEFNHANHQSVFLSPEESWLKPFDKELEAFDDTLSEFPVSFPPSYPFEEKLSEATSYMQTRCPAWCDRVLLSKTAKKLISETDKVEYNLLGFNTCMGDHKPVYLKASIIGDSGIIKCCNHVQYDCLPVPCQCCQSFASIIINVTDMSDYLVNTRKSYDDIAVDSRLLHEPITREMLSHDPYTPESADSHSPNPDKSEQGDLRRNSVSPEQLKSRLEKIAHHEKSFNFDKAKRIGMKRSVSENVKIGGSPREYFRSRAMSELPRKLTRARLISTDSIQSAVRLQSHHSSSDEEWFQFEEADTKHNSSSNINKDCDPVTDLNENDVELKNKKPKKKENRCTSNCCCVM